MHPGPESPRNFSGTQVWTRSLMLHTTTPWESTFRGGIRQMSFQISCLALVQSLYAASSGMMREILEGEGAWKQGGGMQILFFLFACVGGVGWGGVGWGGVGWGGVGWRRGANTERGDEGKRGRGRLLPGGWGRAISLILLPISSCKTETM
jgi:hypothetical protein